MGLWIFVKGDPDLIWELRTRTYELKSGGLLREERCARNGYENVLLPDKSVRNVWMNKLQDLPTITPQRAFVTLEIGV